MTSRLQEEVTLKSKGSSMTFLFGSPRQTQKKVDWYVVSFDHRHVIHRSTRLAGSNGVRKQNGSRVLRDQGVVNGASIGIAIYYYSSACITE